MRAPGGLVGAALAFALGCVSVAAPVGDPAPARLAGSLSHNAAHLRALAYLRVGEGARGAEALERALDRTVLEAGAALGLDGSAGLRLDRLAAQRATCQLIRIDAYREKFPWSSGDDTFDARVASILAALPEPAEWFERCLELLGPVLNPS